MSEGPIQGLSLGLGLDTTGIDQGLKQLKGKLSLVNSEMKANMSAFDRGEKSVQKYETQLGGLNRKLDVQKSAVNSARTQYERMVAQHGEGSRQAERAAAAYNNEVASVNNLERHVNSLTDEFRQFQVEQEAANSGFGRLGASLDNAGGKVSVFGGKMTSAGKGLTLGLTAPILAFGAAGIAAFNEVDAAIDTVITKTGATGQAAEVLTENFRTVAKRVPQDLQSVGDAIGEVNTQFGFMGKELEDASELMLQFADINGTDVTASSIASKQAIEAYGLANSDLNNVLDAVTKTAQDTGQSVDDLFKKATEGAPQIKALGLNFAEGTALIGGFEKAGVDSTAALSSLSKAQVNFAKDGKTLEEGLDDTVKSIMNATNETDALTIASEVFGTKGGPRMVDAIKRGTFNLEDFAGAGEKAAGTVKNTFDETVDPIDQAAIAMNNAKLAIGEVGEEIQVALLPFMEKATSVLGSVADKFRGMSPEAKNAALMIGGIAAAAGPALVVMGTFASGLGAVITFAGSAATAVSIMGTGAAAATPLIGGLATAFTVLTGPIGLGIAAVAGLTVAGVALYNHLKEDAIPEVDRFGDKVSEKTKQALEGFFELSDGASDSLMDLRINGTEITELMADELISKYEDMNAEILAGMKERHAEELKEMEEVFANSSALTQEQEDKIMRQRQVAQDTRIVQQEHYEGRIQEIIEAAATEHRELTQIELDTIDSIHKEMNENAVKYLTENEMEQKIILERMADQADEISARQAADVVKNSASQRDEVIADAEAQYDSVVAFAIRERDETGAISAEEATAIIAEAKKTRDESVGYAESMHTDIVSEAQKQAGEHIEAVDWETGEILSKWDVYTNGVKEKFRKQNEESLADFKKWGEDYTAWSTGVQETTSAFWREWGNGVVARFKKTNEDGMADFRKFGSNYNEWAAGVKESSNKFWSNWGEGIVSRFKRTNNNALSDFRTWGSLMRNAAETGMANLGNGIVGKFESAINGILRGANWVLKKLGSGTQFDMWKGPRFSAGGSGHKGPGGPQNYAEGTKAGGHPGGLAIINDGIGSNAGPELVKFPSGKLTMFKGKDIMLDLPKGSEVLAARDTRKIFGGQIPKYANGIGDVANHLWEGSKNLGGKIANKVFDVFDYLKNPKGLLDIALRSLGISSPGGLGFQGDVLKAGFAKAKNTAVEYVKNQLADFGGSGGLGFGSAFRKTSSFGYRIHPITKRPSFHAGDDYGARPGTLIPAQATGRVVQAAYHALRGNYVRIKSGVLERIYQHNHRNLVGLGDMVKKGQAVGTVGSTGASTGPHLHYEVLKNGQAINPRGLATGGMTKGFMSSTLHEEGYPEIIIPTAPRRRTDAMKLLALAGRKLTGGGDNNVIRPNELPNVQSGGDSQLIELLKQQIALMQQILANPQMIAMVTPNYDLLAEGTAERVGKINERNKILDDLGAGRGGN